ncbi:MAG TPA: DivIVA domain-containing protein [Synergistetes bacterium]|nr:DivIVA domain-containing protein [Synergistota bacterium]
MTVADLLTVIDIENINFRKSMRGYDTDEVEEFLEKVAGSLQIYSEKIKNLEVHVSRFDDQMKEYTELKRSLQDALVLAQKSAEERVNSAESRAEVIIAEAEAQAHKIVIGAKDRVDEHKREIERLRQIRYQFVAEFKGLLAKFGSMLNVLEAPPEDREQERTPERFRERDRYSEESRKNDCEKDQEVVIEPDDPDGVPDLETSRYGEERS